MIFSSIECFLLLKSYIYIIFLYSQKFFRNNFFTKVVVFKIELKPIGFNQNVELIVFNILEIR